MYIRSILEQSCQVWHSSLTLENENELERVQKAALKIILGNKYITYENAMDRLNLESLKIRRENLCLRFAEKCTENPKTKHMFPLKKKTILNKNRNKFKVQFARTTRLQKSSIPYLQKILNKS